MAIDKDALKKIRAGRFRENNGRVLNTINILRGEDYMQLSDLKYALSDIDDGSLADSVNFLQLAGYIHLFHGDKEVRLADADFDELKGLVSASGIRLLSGGIQDSEVILKWA